MNGSLLGAMATQQNAYMQQPLLQGALGNKISAQEYAELRALAACHQPERDESAVLLLLEQPPAD